jgi:hypothetical protein
MATHRGNTISRQCRRKHDCGLLSKRIDHRRNIIQATCNRRHLVAPNDHHQELIRSDERDRWPRGHQCADDAVA